MMYHNPVLATEAIEGLNIDPKGTYVDLTYGGGGHATLILEHLTSGHLYAFDHDPDALEHIPDDKRFTLIPQNYRFMIHYLRFFNAIPVDGILADLGVSSHQFDSAERGFSIRYDAPLDMRMNPATGRTAQNALNNLSVNELAKIITNYGELKDGQRIAMAIESYRKQKTLETTGDLKEAVKHLTPARNENKFLACLFQAIRIHINDELESIKEALEQSYKVLKPGGRLVFISYHSLEDRLVKHFIKTGNFEGAPTKDFYGKAYKPFNIITKKPITPHEKEIKENNRARSAKLRIAEKY